MMWGPLSFAGCSRARSSTRYDGCTLVRRDACYLVTFAHTASVPLALVKGARWKTGHTRHARDHWSLDDRGARSNTTFSPWASLAVALKGIGRPGSLSPSEMENSAMAPAGRA
jgi:hypothetical protein